MVERHVGLGASRNRHTLVPRAAAHAREVVMLTVTRYDYTKGRADEPCEYCGSHTLFFTLHVQTVEHNGRLIEVKQGRRRLWIEDAHCENGHIRLTLNNVLPNRRPTRRARHATAQGR